MGATVIVIDTNQVRDSPMLRNRDWTELSAVADDWDLRFVVSEVCVAEAVSVVRRKWSEEVRSVVANLKVGEFGLNEMQQAMLQQIDATADGYEEALRARLAEIGVAVVPVPDSVRWIDIVHRAVDRRAPYSEGAKDGFRDSLIWCTARAIAADDSECEVWLVSTNHKDFGGDKPATGMETCPYPLHPHLVEELETDGSSGRLSYVRTLGRLKQHLAASYEGLPQAEREALIEHLDREHFERKLVDTVQDLPLNPAAAALPIRTMEASIRAVACNSDGLGLVDAAMRGAGGWTAQFRQTVGAVVDLTDVAGDTASTDKTLTVAGRVEVGSDGSVKQLIVTSAEALPSDAGHHAWTRLQANAAAAKSLGAMKESLAQDYGAAERLEEYFKSMPSAADQMYGMYRNLPSAMEQINEMYRNLPSALDHINEMYRNLPSALDHINEMYKTVPSAMEQVNETYKNVPSAMEQINEMYRNLPSALDHINEMYKTVPSAMEQINALYRNLPSAVDKINEMYRNLPSALDHINEMYKTVPSAMEQVNETYKNVPSAMEQINEMYRNLPSALDRINEMYKTVPSAMEQINALYRNLPSAVDKINEMYRNLPSAADQIREFVRGEQPVSERDEEKSSNPSDADTTTDIGPSADTTDDSGDPPDDSTNE